MSGRGQDDYTSIEEVLKQAKLALVIVERSNWKGTPGNFMRQWNCSISDQGVMWVWIFFKTQNIQLEFVHFTMCKVYI